MGAAVQRTASHARSGGSMRSLAPFRGRVRTDSQQLMQLVFELQKRFPSSRGNRSIRASSGEGNLVISLPISFQTASLIIVYHQ